MDRWVESFAVTICVIVTWLVLFTRRLVARVGRVLLCYGTDLDHMPRKSGTKRQMSNTCSSGEDVQMDELNVPNRSKRVRWDVTSDLGGEPASGSTDPGGVPSEKVCMALFCQQLRIL